MGIENLLAQGVQIRPAGMERNALMQAQEFKDRQQRNALMQMQMQDAMEQRAQARQAAQQQAEWRNALQVPQGQEYVQPGRPAMNAAQAESAVGTPGYGMSSAQDQMRMMPPDPRMVQAVQMAKAGQMSPMDLFKIQNPERKLMGVKADETVIDERTGQPVFTGAPKAEKVDPNKPFMMVDGKVVPNPAYQEYAKSVAKAGATNVSMGTGQKGYENESKLRNDFKSEPIYKDYVEMATAYKQINAGLNAKTPIGDVAAATKVMKLLDPGSVVRESELAIAMAAAGKLDRLQNYLQMKISGETLTPTQRSDFGTLAQELFEAAGDAYNKKRAEYADTGARYGLGDKALGAVHVSTRAKSAVQPAGASTTVTTPDGRVIVFPSAEKAAAFKKEAGL
jgi:hypothetical protein